MRTLARPASRSRLGHTAQPTVLSADETPDEPVAAALVSRGTRLTQRAAAVVAVLVLVFASALPSLIAFFRQQRAIVAVQQQIAAQQEAIDAMRSEIARWSDPAYVQAQARERLGWAVPGETSFIVVGADGKPIGGAATIAPGDATAAGTPSTWYGKLWGSVQTADNPEPAQP